MENVGTEAGPSTSADGAHSAEFSTDFYSTGRIGRRNALPDILSSHAAISTADLPDQLSALTTSDNSSATKDQNAPSTSTASMDVQTTSSTNE